MLSSVQPDQHPQSHHRHHNLAGASCALSEGEMGTTGGVTLKGPEPHVGGNCS